MGQEVEQQEFTREQRTEYREKVRRCLDVFARMLRESRFDAEWPMTGLEIELNLVDELGDPALRGTEALEAIADPDFQTELGQFNLEINVAPKQLRDHGFTDFEEGVRASLNNAEAKASEVGAHMVMIGILPTLSADHMNPESLTPNPRYQLLSDQILAARGEDIVIDIGGPERLRTTTDSIVPEAACTSTQLHTQVSPENFASYWNASQAIAGVQLALGANSPFLLGRELWRETRVPLFEQATDTRSEELKAQGVRPRVWFGERWINSIFDLFEENVRYFPALLPVLEEEDPLEVLESGRTPTLAELRLHNGTIYRWNRPVYDVVDGMPHLRVENRVLPAGPDRRRHDGERRVLLRAGPRAGRARTSALVADVVQRRRGELPRRGRAGHRRQRLLAGAGAGAGHRARRTPAAADGAPGPGRLGGRSPRSATGCSASSSSGASSGRTAPRGSPTGSPRNIGDNDGDRLNALRSTLNQYREHMHTNEPVHTWE